MLRRLASPLLLFVILCCDSLTAPPDGVAISAELSQSVATPGDTLRVTVVVHNSSAETVVVPGSAGGCFAWLEVRRAVDGRLVSHGDERICDMAAVRHHVVPGSELADYVTLSIPSDGERLEPGLYHVRGVVRLEGYDVALSTARPLQVADGSAQDRPAP